MKYRRWNFTPLMTFQIHQGACLSITRDKIMWDWNCWNINSNVDCKIVLEISSIDWHDSTCMQNYCQPSVHSIHFSRTNMHGGDQKYWVRVLNMTVIFAWALLCNRKRYVAMCWDHIANMCYHHKNHISSGGGSSI